MSTNEQYALWSCLLSLSFPNIFSSPSHSESTLAAIRLAASAQRRCYPKGRCAYPPSVFCCALWSCLPSLSSPTIFSSALCIPIPSVSPVYRKKIMCTVLFLLLKKIKLPQQLNVYLFRCFLSSSVLTQTIDPESSRVPAATASMDFGSGTTGGGSG